MKNEEHLWVVEMQSFFFDSDKWYPTIGVALTKEAAVAERKEWIKKNSGIPAKLFRVTKYVRAA